MSGKRELSRVPLVSAYEPAISRLYRMRWMLSLFVTSALLISGCGSDDQEMLMSSIEQLQDDVERLQSEVDHLSEEAASTTTSPAVGRVEVVGLLRLKGDNRMLDITKEGVECAGDGGFQDIHEGANVVIRGPADQVVAASALETGIRKGDLLEGACTFRFVAEVPTGLRFYTFSIAGRDGPTLAESDLEADGWRAELHLGT